MIAYMLIALLLGAVISILPYITGKLFNNKTRYTGLSVSYNMAQCIGGGLVPILIILAIDPNINFTVPNLIILCAALALISVALLVINNNKKRI